MVISHYAGVEPVTPEPAASPPVQRHLFPFSFLPPSGFTGQFVWLLVNFGLEKEGFMAPGLQPRPAHGRYPCCCRPSALHYRLFRHFRRPWPGTASRCCRTCGGSATGLTHRWGEPVISDPPVCVFGFGFRCSTFGEMIRRRQERANDISPVCSRCLLH